MSVLRAIFKIVLWLVCLGFLCFTIAIIHLSLQGRAPHVSIDARNSATLAGIRPLVTIYLENNGNSADGLCPETLGSLDENISGIQKTIHIAINNLLEYGNYNPGDSFGCAVGIDDPSNWAIWFRLQEIERSAFCVGSKKIETYSNLPTYALLHLPDATCPYK